MQRILLLCIASLLVGCASAPQVGLTSIHGECRRSEEWLAQFAVRRAVRVDSALLRAQRTGLVVQARAASGATDTVLIGAQIQLYRGDRQESAALIGGGEVGPRGWFEFDTPAIPSAFVRTRWYGFVPRGEVVQLREGYRDTVIVHLRFDVVCLSS